MKQMALYGARSSVRRRCQGYPMHLAGPRPQQHRGGLRHGAAGGVNIVAEQYALAGNKSLSRLAQRKATG